MLYAEDLHAAAALTAKFTTLLQPAPRRVADPRRLTIVRPDAYVGFDGVADAWSAAEGYLKGLAA